MVIHFDLFLISGLVIGVTSRMIYRTPNATYKYLYIRCIPDETVDVPTRTELGMDKTIFYVYQFAGKKTYKIYLPDVYIGYIYSRTSNIFAVEYYMPPCILSGRHFCRILGANIYGNESQVDLDTLDYKVTTLPADLKIRVEPNKLLYRENDTILIECLGMIGNPPMEWHWSTRDSNISNSNVSWHNVTDGVINGELQAPGEGDCQYSQETHLRYIVKRCDEGREFQCSLGSSYPQSFKLHLENSHPSYLEVKAEPQKPVYEANEDITLICVGYAENFTNWLWNSRVIEGSNFTGDWKNFTNSTTDDVQDESLDSQCPYHQGILMKYTIKKDDDGRQFRCTSGERISNSFEIRVLRGTGSTIFPQMMPLHLFVAVCLITIYHN